MALKIDVDLPEDLVIGDGWTLEWDAVDPVSGASIPGVIVSEANIVTPDSASGTVETGEPVGPFMLVPGPDG